MTLMTVDESQEKAEEAFEFLDETNEQFANAKAWSKATDKLRKSKRAQIYLSCDLKTDGQRNNYAESHEDYINAIKVWQKSIYDFEIINAERNQADNYINYYRSLNGARNKGFV